MKRIISHILTLTGFVLVLHALAGCDTAVKPLELVEGDIARDNPELYAAYLSNLKTYKASDHILVYAWFDNSVEEPFSRSQHFTVVPDSVDYIAPMTPDRLPAWQVDEMKGVRADKGTKFLFTVDFDAIKAAYNAMMELDEDNEPTAAGFQQYLIESLQASWAAFDKYAAVYDGIAVRYTGKSTLHQTAPALKEYKANENLFLGLVNAWLQNHADKEYTFVGKPQNVMDPAFFDKAKAVILSQGLEAANPDAFNFYVYMSMVEGVPTDRVGMLAYSPTSDPTDPARKGYITDDTFFVDVMSEWASVRHEGFTVKAIALYDINEDYYSNPAKIYYHTRNAIDTVNPAIK